MARKSRREFGNPADVTDMPVTVIMSPKLLVCRPSPSRALLFDQSWSATRPELTYSISSERWATSQIR